MTLAQLRTALRLRIGSPSTTDVPDANLTGHVNSAYQEILNKYKFKRRRGKAKFSTQIGVSKYIVSDLTDVIYTVWDRTNGKMLERVGKTKLAQEDYNSTPPTSVQNGKPTQWDHAETYLHLLPAPDAVYQIEFVYKVIFVALSLDADVPIIPFNWHRGIIILGAHIYYDDEGSDPQKAVYHKNQFRDWVADQPVEEHEATESIDSGVQVPSLSGGAMTRRPDGIWWDSDA